MVSVKKNTVLNIIRTLSSVVFPLITFPYISRVLHAENIGKVNFGNSIISYASLIASLGISTYAIRECSKVRDDKEKLNDISSQLLSINLISTLVSYVFLIFLLLFWNFLHEYKILIIIQSLAVIFTTLGADWINTAMEDFKYITIRSLVFQLISIVAMFLFVRKPEDYVVYAAITVLSSSGANIVNIVYRRRFCKTRITFHIDWKTHMPPIFMLFAVTLFSIIYTNVDMTMLGIMKGDKDVGIYSTAVKIYNIVNMTVASIAAVVLPQLSYNFNKKDYAEVNRLILYAARFIAVLGLPCIAGIDAIAEEIVTVVACAEYVSAAVPLRILSIALLFSYMGGLVGNMILIPSGKEKICLVATGISAALNFIGNLLLIPKLGIVAAALTTAVSEVF